MRRTTVPPREPVLRPGLFFGLGIPDARGTRVWVDDRRAVWMRRPDRDPVEVAGPDALSKVSVVAADRLRQRRFTPAARRGLVLLWSGDDLVAALNLTELGADRPYPDDATFRAVVGLDAFAQALGLAVEPPTEAEVRRARRLRQRDLLPLHDPANHHRWTAPLAILALLCSFLTWPAVGSGLEWPVLAAAFATTAPSVLTLWRRRRRLLQLLTTPLDPEGRETLRPAPPADLSTRQLLGTEVQVGGRDIVVRSGGQEWWLPGPLAGGIAQATLSRDALVLSDRRDRPYVGLDPVVWGPHTDALLEALTRQGVRIQRTPLPDARVVEFVGARHDATRWLVPRPHEDASDNNVAAAAPQVAVAVLGVGCVALAVADFPLGLAVLPAWAALQWCAFHAWFGLSRWTRQQRTATGSVRGSDQHTGAVS